MVEVTLWIGDTRSWGLWCYNTWRGRWVSGMEKFVSVSEESVTDRCSMKFLKEIDRGRLHFKTAWETRLGQWLLLCAMLLCAIWAMGCGLWAMGYGLVSATPQMWLSWLQYAAVQMLPSTRHDIEFIAIILTPILFDTEFWLFKKKLYSYVTTYVYPVNRTSCP